MKLNGTSISPTVWYSGSVKTNYESTRGRKCNPSFGATPTTPYIRMRYVVDWHTIGIPLHLPHQHDRVRWEGVDGGRHESRFVRVWEDTTNSIEGWGCFYWLAKKYAYAITTYSSIHRLRCLYGATHRGTRCAVSVQVPSLPTPIQEQGHRDHNLGETQSGPQVRSGSEAQHSEIHHQRGRLRLICFFINISFHMNLSDNQL